MAQGLRAGPSRPCSTAQLSSQRFGSVVHWSPSLSIGAFMRKDEYPRAIADLLSIPPIQGSGGAWMSTEGTVLRDWLEAIGEALDVPYAGQKVLMMQHLVEAVGQEWDPATCASTLTESGGGGNIAKPAFERLLAGLSQDPVSRRRATANVDNPGFDETLHTAAEDVLSLRAIRVRKGQPRFRARLLWAYDGQCAVSACDAASTLEAAHIKPHSAGGSYESNNGLLLRADLHTLFDLRLMTMDPATYSVILHPEVRRGYYSDLHGRRIRLPNADRDWPDRDALSTHRIECGF